jgi:membrane-bound lytic murein transglycosylase D
LSKRISATRLAAPALVVLATALQACTSLLEPPTAPPAPTQIPAPIPAAERTAVATVDPATVAEGIVAASQPAAEPDGPTDLFERIRAGFQLDDPEQSRIDVQLRWYANNPGYLERVFGRSELYFHHIVNEIERRGMPLEIALLPVVESAFEPWAYSSARAAGLWQFIPGTGTRFALNQNWWYDGRRDVLESTRAALDYLQYMHAKFDGDWLLAIAGYNCGEGCVGRAVARNRSAGLPIDFWNLRLPAETRAYVPKLLAMKRLVANPEAYGIGFSPIPNEPYFVRVEAGSQIDLKLAAELAGITHEQLFELNPAFHRWATPPQGPHHLLLPIEAADLFRQNLAQLTPDELLRVTHHIVQPGETLATLATRYQTTPQVIRQINGLGDGPIAAGADLRVPSGSTALPDKVLRAAARVDGRGGSASGRRPVIHVVRRGDSLWKIARRHNMDVNTLMRLNGLKPGQTLQTGKRLRLASAGGASSGGGSSGSSQSAGSSSGGSLTHTVRRGDTLYRIARLHGVTVAQLLSWNGIGVNAPLKPGQKITVKVPRRR